MAEERFHNEIRMLRYLEKAGCPFVPRVLSSDEENLVLVMTNCGQPVSRISQEKMDALFAELESFGVRHKDQASRNVTYDVRRNRFCVIDFEFAEVVERNAELEQHWNGISWGGRTECGPVRPRNDDSLSVFTLQRG
ncbi:MAG: hypothetical protein AAF514_12350, partial [Verrucomicrobiota bacterium]